MDDSRRDFLKMAGSVAATAAVIGTPLAVHAQEAQSASGIVSEHTLPPLPYAFDALEPFIDARTVEIHHDKHHAGYVKALIGAEDALAKARTSGDLALVQHWSRKAAFAGGGCYLHKLYWETMAPHGKGGGGEPEGALAQAISRDFGSFAAFQKHFNSAAADVEANGWCSLHYRFSDQRLLVLQTENHQKQIPGDSMALLTIDVWEHAYYLKYQNARAEYIKQWWNLVNWPRVAEYFIKAEAMGKIMAEMP